MMPADPNEWPTLNVGPQPQVSKRPYWRYPSRADFFVLCQGGHTRVDLPSREIDMQAMNAKGDVIHVARDMTWVETAYYMLAAIWHLFRPANIFAKRPPLKPPGGPGR